MAAAAGGRLTIDLGALADNWRWLSSLARRARTAAVVKADAYGLGIADAVPALYKAGCRDFFVALAFEGERVRAVAPEARIFVLNGYFAGSAALYAASDLIPIAGCRADVAAWIENTGGGDPKTARPFALQIDTGMNRAGLSPDEAVAYAASMDAGIAPAPVMVMTHLACADTPSNPKNRQQRESFQRVRAAFSGIESSMANSGGVFLGTDFHYDLTRPGIALYGAEAVDGVENPMRPVVTLEARIASVRTACAGETVSYGASQTLTRDTVLATCSVGYADGYPRAASGAGVPLRGSVAEGACGFFAGRTVPIAGRVTMDLTIFDVTDCPVPPGPGDHIELFGPNIAIDDAARAAGTIGYELLTGLSRRYCRRIVER